MATMEYILLYPTLLIVLTGSYGIDSAHVVYDASANVLRNPDRGFYVHTEAKTSNFEPLTDYDLRSIRDSQASLVLRLYVLDTFVTSDLSSLFLANFTNDLTRVKEAGLSCILRFCYANSYTGARDASKYWVLRHIRSLAPVLAQYSDVISALQAGFIGIWGEWYLSDNFGEPWTNQGYLGLTDQHWQDRSEVLNTLLDNVPHDIPILLRTPYYKMKLLEVSTPVTFDDVTSSAPVGRIGHHNDCFLRTSTDMGTYLNPTVERPYLAEETRFVPNGGETCGFSDDNGVPTSRSECPTALQELNDYHFSFLNRNYHAGVLQSWKDGGCWEEVKAKLGYSLRLKEGDLPSTVASGGILQLSITISNTGWAAPYRLYTVLLVLKAACGVHYTAQLTADPRTWSAGSDHVIQGSVKVPSSISAGSYEMYIGIVQAGLSGIADFYILLGNTNVPRAVSGLNSLLHTIKVEGSVETTSTLPTLDIWTPPTQTGFRACTVFPVPNYSFETQTAWQDYAGVWTSDSSQAQEGGKSAKITNGGAVQEFHFSNPVRRMTLSGYSKNVNGPSSVPSTTDYSLYCDLTKASGGNIWGLHTPFSLGNSNWHKVTLTIDVPESDAFVMARCHVLYRNAGSGEAFFDNINAFLPSDDLTDPSQCS